MKEATVFPKRMVKEDVLTLARQRVRTTFDMCDVPVVSCSGGKDSTVVLHLAEEEAVRRGQLPLKVVFWDEEAIAPDTADYMERLRKNKRFEIYWLCLPIQHRNACSRKHPNWYPWAPEDEAKWCRPLPKGAIVEADVAKFKFLRRPIPECHWLIHAVTGVTGTLGLMLGIRAQESMRRFMSVSRRGYNNFISRDNAPAMEHCPERANRRRAEAIFLSKPIYDWMVEDVWTAPQKFGWDFNPAYDTMTRAGISIKDQRVCPPYGEEPLQNLWMYAQCWPDLWEKMVMRVPGAATAGRFSRSPMYGHGTIDGWDDTADPKALIQKALERWPLDQRGQIADRIKREINLHYQQSNGDEIPRDANFGLSWRFLYMIAVRGDLKGRKQLRLQRGADGKRLNVAKVAKPAKAKPLETADTQPDRY